MELPSKGFGGQRERNKTDKLRRIKAAARDLFLLKGFDEATTREIAARAGVGIGTVFTYAENKRDLLFLVANDELEALTAKGEAGVAPDRPCLDNLLRFFGIHYAYYGRQPELSRMMLREMTFYDSGRQASRFQHNRERIIRIIGGIVATAQRTGELRSREQPDFIGWVLFCVYQVELRRWLLTREPLAAGMRQLERALVLFMAGLDPAPAAPRKRPGRPAGRKAAPATPRPGKPAI